MREMDILCTRFVEQVYGQLDETGRRDLERLLECADQDILAWLTGNGAPSDPALADLVLQMRDVTSQR